MSLLKRITGKLIRIKNLMHYQDKCQFEPELMNNIIQHNRNLVNKNFEIVNKKIMQESHFGYGIPAQLYSNDNFKLNNPINNDITYTDVICYFSNKLKNIRYLELGVSVGKNIYQLVNYLNESYLVGFDLEEINPLLKEKFNSENVSKEKWEKGIFLKPTGPSYTQNMKYKSNTIDYLASDIYDESGWEKLRNKQFNLILSDASHTPGAILFEFKMMEKYNVFNKDSFVIFWDDLGGEMTDSFLSIISQMKKKYNVKRSNCYVLELSGWIGQQEFKHQIGIIDKS